MHPITPFLWFDNQAEEAAGFYVSVFRNSRVTRVIRCGDGGPGPKGSVLTVDFELGGRAFTALNGGPHFRFNEAVSFVIACDSQEELDAYWEKLSSDGGQPGQCGWLKDKYGLSWQVTPANLAGLLADPETSARVMPAMMQMGKLDIAKLREAAAAS